MIQPSVGRIVWYHPHALDGGDVNGQPHAAIVAHVLSDRLINLTVFNENGSVYSRQNVTLLQGDEDNATTPTSDFAEWMPFQKGQAAKTEQIAAAPAPSLVLVHEKIDALDKGVQGKFESLGDWLKRMFTDFETRLTALNEQKAPPLAPAAPEAAPAAPGAIEAQPNGTAAGEPAKAAEPVT